MQVIIGSDVAYERRHVAGLAAAIARHLAPSGRALLCCPIREQVHPGFWLAPRLLACVE